MDSLSVKAMSNLLSTYNVQGPIWAHGGTVVNQEEKALPSWSIESWGIYRQAIKWFKHVVLQKGNWKDAVRLSFAVSS